MDDIRTGWEQWFLLTTDRHWDHPCSDRALQKKHLNEALQKRAGIMDAGDLFCAMQGRDDKRGGKAQVRAEHNSSAYFDSLVDTGSDWFAPFAKNWITMSPGNHETAVQKRHEINLTERLVTTLNLKHHSHIEQMTYAGWVRFIFKRGGGHRDSKRMFYHHGFGGGGPVTRGVIDTNRMAVYQPDADIVWTGHTHDQWVVPIRRARLSDLGVPFLDEQLHVRTPGYKDEFSPMQGFHIEKGRGPKPIGAAWLRFYYLNDHIHSDILPAK